MVQNAFEQQEFGLLDHLLRVTSRAGRQFGDLPEVAVLANVPLRIVDLLQNTGLQVERVHPAVMASGTLDANVLSSDLPTELAELVLDMGRRLKNEASIETNPSYYAPRSSVARDTVRRAEQRQEEIRKKYLPVAADLVSRLIKEAIEGRQERALVSLLGAAFLTAERLLVGDDEPTARVFLRAGLNHLDTALDSSVLNEPEKRRTIEQLRALVLRSIDDNVLPILEVAGPRLVRALARRGESDEMARYDLLALLAIANIAAELRGDPELRDLLLSGLDAAGLDRAQFARAAQDAAHDNPFGMYVPPEHLRRYGEWAQGQLNEIRRLPQRPVSGPGEIGYDLEVDHESALVRALGGHTSFGDINEAIHLFLELLVPPMTMDALATRNAEVPQPDSRSLGRSREGRRGGLADRLFDIMSWFRGPRSE